MRILYIANFQSERLIRTRSIRRNRSLGGTTKISALTASLVGQGHHVTIFTPGVSAERTGRFYPAYDETIAVAGQEVPVVVCSTWDYPVLNRSVSTISLIGRLRQLLRRERFDAAIVYNCYRESLVAAWLCRRAGLPVVLEYEDGATMARVGQAGLLQRLGKLNEDCMRSLTCGTIAVTGRLAEVMGHPHRIVLPGALSQGLLDRAAGRVDDANPGRPMQLLYSGNLDPSKGIDILLDAAALVDRPIVVNITGKGVMADLVTRKCRELNGKAVYHGVVSTDRLAELMTTVDIGVNPHRIGTHGGGLWPFKVLEYVAGCGVVVSARMNSMMPELASRLHFYEGENPADLAAAITAAIDNWPAVCSAAPANRQWAASEFSPDAIGRRLTNLLQAVRDQNGSRRPESC